MYIERYRLKAEDKGYRCMTLPQSFLSVFKVSSIATGSLGNNGSGVAGSHAIGRPADCLAR